jgi:phage shock protein C
VDRRNGKILGVCAGIANLTGWDVTFVRVAAVLLMLVGPFPWTLLPYALAGLLARKKSEDGGFEIERRTPRATEEVLREAHSIGLRTAEVESCVASANGGLAREIERLR